MFQPPHRIIWVSHGRVTSLGTRASSLAAGYHLRHHGTTTTITTLARESGHSASSLSATVEGCPYLVINMNTHTPPAASQGTTTAANRDPHKQETQEKTKKPLHVTKERVRESMGGGDGGGDDGGLNISDILYLTDVDSEALCLHPIYQQ